MNLKSVAITLNYGKTPNLAELWWIYRFKHRLVPTKPFFWLLQTLFNLRYRQIISKWKIKSGRKKLSHSTRKVLYFFELRIFAEYFFILKRNIWNRIDLKNIWVFYGHYVITIFNENQKIFFHNILNSQESAKKDVLNLQFSLQHIFFLSFIYSSYLFYDQLCIGWNCLRIYFYLKVTGIFW